VIGKGHGQKDYVREGLDMHDNREEKTLNFHGKEYIAIKCVEYLNKEVETGCKKCPLQNPFDECGVPCRLPDDERWQEKK